MSVFHNPMLLSPSGASSFDTELIGNSVHINGTDEFLGKTFSSGSAQTKVIISTWVQKTRDSSGGSEDILCAHGGTGGASRQNRIHFTTANLITIQIETTAAATIIYDTAKTFEDIGWYHIVFGMDAANTTCSIEVNGVAQTLTGTFPSDTDYAINNNTLQAIGRYSGGGSATNYLDGYQAETVFIDGTLYTATDFGEFDSTGLYWTPKSSAEIKALTFGTNGFYLDNTTNAQTDAHLAAPTVVLPSVNFDGSNDYLSYSGDPMPDGTSGTFSCWFKFNGTSAAEIEYFYQSAGTYFDIRRNSDGAINIIYYTASNTYTGQFKTSTSFTAVSDGWHHIVASWNTATTTQLMFVDGVADLTSVKNVSGTIDYTRGSHNLGASASGGGKIITTGSG